MNWQLYCKAALIVTSAGFGSAAAGLHVLGDTGRTVSSVQYLVHALDSTDSDTETSLVSFPVHAGGLSPGKLDPVDRRLDIPAWLTRPIFIVGNDPTSSRWLADHHTALLRLGAAGIVVSVPDVPAFKAMRRASSLPLVPHPAPHLARLLIQHGVAHYPLLILENGQVLQDLGVSEAAGRSGGRHP